MENNMIIKKKENALNRQKRLLVYGNQLRKSMLELLKEGKANDNGKRV